MALGGTGDQIHMQMPPLIHKGSGLRALSCTMGLKIAPWQGRWEDPMR